MQTLQPYLKAKQHVIWDWNGTLLSDIEHAVQITNRMLVEENLPTIQVEHYKQIFRFPVIDYYRDIGFDTSPEKFIDLCERFNRHFKEGVHNCQIWPAARPLLREVKFAGKVQSVLSASEQSMLLHQVELFAVGDYFDHLFGIHDKAAGSKIDRGHELLRTAGVPAADTVLIGDTDHDFEVGQALGIDVVLVEHGHQHADRLRRVHHTVVKVF